MKFIGSRHPGAPYFTDVAAVAEGEQLVVRLPDR